MSSLPLPVPVLALLLLCAHLAHPWTNQSVVIGRAAYYDRLLFQDKAVLYPKRGQSVVYNLRYPPYFSRNQGERITSIQIIDQWLNGSNGNVFIGRGGVGEKFVNLSIRSLLNQGLSYLIYVYGRIY